MLALTAVCGAWAGTPDRIGEIVKQYSGREGFEVMNLGRFFLGMLKGAALLDKDLDSEERAALDAFNGIRNLMVVDFEDAPQADKDQFCHKVEKALKKMELIMEAKDSGETLRIYGLNEGNKLKDIILYRSDGALVSMTGTIGLEHVGKLIDTAK